MQLFVDGIRRLRLDDGTPVTAASAVAPLGDGWLIARGDATSAAWHRPGSVTPVRLPRPAEGHVRFSASAGTERLGPGLELACPAALDGDPAVLLLGSGSSGRRTRGILVRLVEGVPGATGAELGPLYAQVAARLGVPMDRLDLVGAARLGGVVRWFSRGDLATGTPSASVDLPLAALVDAVLGRIPAAAVPVERPRRYDLPAVDRGGLAVTDAVALPDGRLILSAAAEVGRNTVGGGPVTAPALVLVDDDRVVAIAPVPGIGGTARAIEGLALRVVEGRSVHLLAVVDDDDRDAPSAELDLRLEI